VTRYDRSRADEGMPAERLHQEDLCQGLGFVPELKYESDGGPGIEACADFLRERSAAPAVDILAFADLLIYNLIIGNNDAHSKNHSMLLEGPGAPRLAPAYDLLSTVAYPDLHRKTAMKYGGENRPDYIRSRHLERTAGALGMTPRAFVRRAMDLCERIESAIDPAREELDFYFSSRPVLGQIVTVIEQGLRRIRAEGGTT
jgi:serine/threonine-protein kinase HipA